MQDLYCRAVLSAEKASIFWLEWTASLVPFQFMHSLLQENSVGRCSPSFGGESASQGSEYSQRPTDPGSDHPESDSDCGQLFESSSNERDSESGDQLDDVGGSCVQRDDQKLAPPFKAPPASVGELSNTKSAPTPPPLLLPQHGYWRTVDHEVSLRYCILLGMIS